MQRYDYFTNPPSFWKKIISVCLNKLENAFSFIPSPSGEAGAGDPSGGLTVLSADPNATSMTILALQVEPLTAERRVLALQVASVTLILFSKDQSPVPLIY